MKKILVISAVILLSCVTASAQWYLFPGKGKKNKDKENSPAPQDTVAAIIPDAPEPSEEQTFDDVFTLDIPQTVHMSLILPFQISSKTNSNFMEMYFGALMAARDYCRDGNEVELTVLDEAEAETPVTSDLLANSHITIGPVGLNNIKTKLEICPENKYLISPLEPKAAALTDSSRIVQAPVPWERQVEELVSWIVSDLKWDEELIVLFDAAQNGIGEQTAFLLGKLEASGARYRTVSDMAEFNPQEGTTRCLIASDRDSFINAAARDLSVLLSAAKNRSIILYGTSKVRNSLGIEPEHLYNLSLHYTTGYFIDYENPAVKNFILSYRSLFKTEPGSFAFQGYDITHYFLNICKIYGVQWYKKLPEYSERGLQADFRFEESEKTGRTNCAVRKVMLGQDLSAVVLQ